MRRVALLLAAVLLVGCSATGEPRQVGVGGRIPIGDGISQTLVPTADGMSAITVWTAYDDGPPRGVLFVEVVVAGDRRSVTVDGAGFAVNQPVRIAFDPVPESGGEVATVSFRWSGRPDLALLGTRVDAYADGELRPGPGDLRFVVGHADRIAGTLDVAGQLADEAAGRVADDPVFAVLWFAALVGLAVVAVRGGRSAVARRRQ